jgi:mono/diheme cytochrome c family protein
VVPTNAISAVIAFAALVAPPTAFAAPDAEATYASSAARAQFNWVMHCQGCHGAEAQGTPGSVPRLAGNVGRFLQIAAGRAYLGRVPGVAFVELSDAELAELLNWVVQHFDAEHLPKAFTPYSGDEIRTLRREPLISNALRERKKVLESLSQRR